MMRLVVTWVLAEAVKKDAKKQEILVWPVKALEEKVSWQALVVGHCTFDDIHSVESC